MLSIKARSLKGPGPKNRQNRLYDEVARPAEIRRGPAAGAAFCPRAIRAVITFSGRLRGLSRCRKVPAFSPPEKAEID